MGTRSRGALLSGLVKMAFFLQYFSAIVDLEKSLAIGTTNIKAMTLSRLGRAFMSQKEWNRAEKYLKESLEWSRKVPDYIYWLVAIGRLAIISAEKKEYDRFDEFNLMLNEALEQIQTPDESSLGMVYIGLAKLAIGQNNINKVEFIVDYLEKGIVRIIENGPYASTDILKRLFYIEKDFAPIDLAIIHTIGQRLSDIFIKKEINDIAYSAVTPLMIKWANWKKEEAE